MSRDQSRFAGYARSRFAPARTSIHFIKDFKRNRSYRLYKSGHHHPLKVNSWFNWECVMLVIEIINRRRKLRITKL